MNGDARVGAIRPELAAIEVGDVSLGAVKPDVGHRHFDGPFAAGLALERNVAPKRDGHRVLASVRGDDFLAKAVGFAEVGAKNGAGAARHPGGHSQAEANTVPDEADQSLAGRWSHDWLIHRDFFIGQVGAEFKRREEMRRENSKFQAPNSKGGHLPWIQAVCQRACRMDRAASVSLTGTRMRTGTYGPKNCRSECARNPAATG